MKTLVHITFIAVLLVLLPNTSGHELGAQSLILLPESPISSLRSSTSEFQSATDPVLFFSDLVSGPKTGNSDTTIYQTGPSISTASRSMPLTPSSTASTTT